jgi:cyclopropane-fatty-acyl-phospholipid synthase
VAGHLQPLCLARLKLHDEERQRTNQHYDLDPHVFSLFLDSSLKYSSGLYLTEDDTLDQAQIQKMSFIADQLVLKGGEKVPDIGCSWGSLVCFLAERYGCTVVGVTPSPKQAAYIQERARRLGPSDRVLVQVAHIQEPAFAPGSFDAITLVGSIVHMKEKRGVIAECYRLCRRRGRVYLSETCFRNWRSTASFPSAPERASSATPSSDGRS